MRILIPTMETRGDIQPYIAFAKEQNQDGYHTIINSHPWWQELVESYDIIFHQLLLISIYNMNQLLLEVIQNIG